MKKKNRHCDKSSRRQALRDTLLRHGSSFYPACTFRDFLTLGGSNGGRQLVNFEGPTRSVGPNRAQHTRLYDGTANCIGYMIDDCRNCCWLSCLYYSLTSYRKIHGYFTQDKTKSIWSSGPFFFTMSRRSKNMQF